jgi:hypothetical protein
MSHCPGSVRHVTVVLVRQEKLRLLSNDFRAINQG